MERVLNFIINEWVGKCLFKMREASLKKDHNNGRQLNTPERMKMV